MMTATPSPSVATEDYYTKVSSMSCTDELRGKIKSSELAVLEKWAEGKGDEYIRHNVSVSGRKGVAIEDNPALIVFSSFLCHHFSLGENDQLLIYQDIRRKNKTGEFIIIPPE